MRNAVFLFVTLVFLVPSVLFAVEKFDPKAVTGSGDICLNEEVVIFNGKPIFEAGSTNTDRYKTCKNISGGCTFAKEKTEPSQCTCGRLTVTPPGKKSSKLDKCDPNFKRNFEKALAGGAEGMSAFAAQALISQRIQDVDVSTQDGRGKLSQILQNYGLSENEADAKVNDEDKAATVQAQLKQFVSTSDTDEASKIADRLGLRLNKDLTDEVRLDREKYTAVLTKGDIENWNKSVPFTFREIERAGVADTLAPLCGRLGGCSNSVCLSNPYSLTCQGNNPGALTFTPRQSKYGGRPCGLNNNTTCFDTIEGGIAAQANLLTTNSRYFAGGNNTILGAFCNGYSTSNCAEYAAFISGQTGIPLNQTIDPNNARQIAAIMMASSRFENGRGVIYTPEQLQKGLEVAFGGAQLPEGTPGYLARTVFGTNGGTQFGSPFNLGSSASPATVGYGSAFGYAGQAPVAPASYSQPQQTTPISQPTPGVVGSQPRPSTPTSTVAEDLARAIQDPSAARTGRLMASIIVQESEVRRGNPVQVSWTSVGMSADKPCVVRAGSQIIAEKNQGTSVVPTTQATRIGSLVFYLTCATPSGAAYQRTAAVMVR